MVCVNERPTRDSVLLHSPVRTAESVPDGSHPGREVGSLVLFPAERLTRAYRDLGFGAHVPAVVAGVGLHRRLAEEASRRGKRKARPTR